MGRPRIAEYWASEDAPVRRVHPGVDGSPVEEHGYFDTHAGGVQTYRAEFRRKVDAAADEAGFNPDGYVRVVVRGGHAEDVNKYEVLAGGDIDLDTAERDVVVCGYLVIDGEIDEVRRQALELIADFKNWKSDKYTYHEFKIPKL